MDRAEKQNMIDGLAMRFRHDSIIAEYRGLSVAALNELRSSLRGNATFKVTKNTLARRAASDAKLDLASMLTGPSAIAFIDGDVAKAAKGLLDFAKANPLLVIKGGVLDGRVLDAKSVSKLADLEPREVLLAKLAGAMKATQTRAAGTLSAPITHMARLLRAKEERDGEAQQQ